MSALSPAELASLQQRVRTAVTAQQRSITVYCDDMLELCRGYAESEGYRSNFPARPAGKLVIISHPRGLECTVTETETSIHYSVE